MIDEHLAHAVTYFISEESYTFRISDFPDFQDQMFADLHHLHHFISLEQGGSVTATSWVAGTNQGEADIYFG